MVNSAIYLGIGGTGIVGAAENNTVQNGLAVTYIPTECIV